MQPAHYANPTLSRWLGFPDLSRLPENAVQRKIVQPAEGRQPPSPEGMARLMAGVAKANKLRAEQAAIRRAQIYLSIDTFTHRDSSSKINMSRLVKDGWIESYAIVGNMKYYRKTAQGIANAMQILGEKA